MNATNNQLKREENYPQYHISMLCTKQFPALTYHLKSYFSFLEAVGRGIKRMDEVCEHQCQKHQHVCNPLVN